MYDKEVLVSYCNKNTLNFNEIAYDEFVTDIINQNLKDETGKIKSICGITFNVNPEKFKLNLSECISKNMKVYEELESCIFNRK